MKRFFKTAELAAALGMQNASISMALKNGKLIRGEDKTYDLELPENKEWVNEMIVRGKVFDISKAYEKENRVKTRKAKQEANKKDKEIIQAVKKIKNKKVAAKIAPVKKVKPKAEPEQLTIPTPAETKDDNYYKKKRALELRKVKNQVILDELKIQKIKGLLIPYDAVKTVFLFAAETFRSTYLQEVDALSNVFIKRLGGTHDNFVELQKALQEKINDIQKQVKDDLLQGLSGIQAEYKEVRGRGERK